MTVAQAPAAALWSIGAADGVALISVIRTTAGLFGVVASQPGTTMVQQYTMRCRSFESAKRRALQVAGFY